MWSLLTDDAHRTGIKHTVDKAVTIYTLSAGSDKYVILLNLSGIQHDTCCLCSFRINALRNLIHMKLTLHCSGNLLKRHILHDKSSVHIFEFSLLILFH